MEARYCDRNCDGVPTCQKIAGRNGHCNYTVTITDNCEMMD